MGSPWGEKKAHGPSSGGVAPLRGSRTRPQMPLGREVALPVPMRAPPGWSKGRPWPPPLSEVVEKIRGQRNPRYSLMWIFTHSGAVAMSGWPSESNILAGIKGFMDCADLGIGYAAKGVDYRSPSLWNAAVLGSVLPSRTLARISVERLREAVSCIGPETLAEVRSVIERMEARALAILRPDPLDWDRHRLVPASPGGRSRLRSNPRIFDAEGAWPGITGVMLESGWLVPADSPWPVVRLRQSKSCFVCEEVAP